jgi:two-component system CitB family sensor kinase
MARTLGRIAHLGDTERVSSRSAGLSLATQLFLLQVSVVAFVLISGGVLTFLHARGDNEISARRRVLDVAQTLARSPDLDAAFREPDPARRLQPLAESVRHVTGVDFVVIMNPDGVRYSHPDPGRIGGLFLGHVEPALRGRPFTETYTGTLGPSVRAVVPVLGSDSRVDGLVAVGITRAKISEQILHRIPSLTGVIALGFGLAALGALLVSRRLRRQTLGLGPAEITRMYEHHDAVLHAVREGLLVFGRDRRLLLANDEAIRLLGLHSDDEGRPVTDLTLPGSLRELVASGRIAVDEIHLTDDRTIVINQAPALRDGRPLGTVTTLRDHTELKALSGELDSVRGFAEALRAQAHEAANRLHTVVSLIELNRAGDAVTFATAELAAAQELTDRLLSAISEPVLAALLLGKAAEANERGVEFLVTEDTEVVKIGVDSRDLVTLVGNLVDNAIEAALEAPPPRKVGVTVRADEKGTVVCVRDSGTGLDPGHVADAFTRGWSTKNASGTKSRGLGLALVHQAVTRHGGTIDVTRDEGAVFTVHLPGTDAVEDR